MISTTTCHFSQPLQILIASSAVRAIPARPPFFMTAAIQASCSGDGRSVVLASISTRTANVVPTISCVTTTGIQPFRSDCPLTPTLTILALRKTVSPFGSRPTRRPAQNLPTCVLKSRAPILEVAALIWLVS